MPSTPANLYAIFALTPYTLTMAASPTAGGTASATGSNPRHAADSITASQTPNAGYCFVNWTDGTAAIKTRKPSYAFTMPAATTR